MKAPQGHRLLKGPLCLAGALALCLAALLFSACGVKSPPYPAEATLPNKVEELNHRVTEEGEVIISWRAPKLNMVGRPLKDLGGFEILLAEYPLDEHYCQSCPHQYRPVDRLSPLDPPPGLELASGPYQWRYPLKDNHVYRFRVLALSSSGASHPAAWSETIVWSLPGPEKAPSLNLRLSDRLVELSWPKPAAGYAVELQKRVGEGSWAPVSGLEPASGRYQDAAVNYEQDYSYRARLCRQAEASSIPGPWSEEKKVRVIDLTPPPPPGHLSAGLAQGGVQLRWESLEPDPDLAGYRVYRRLSGEEEFTLLNKRLLTVNSFFDPIVLDWETTARYRVTSVDRSPRANESQPSPGADVMLDPYVEPPERPQ